MAITLNEQISIYPPGGGSGTTDWLDDGEGMHTLVPLDLIRGLNNLGSYGSNWMQYVQQSNVGSGGSTDPNGESIVTPTAGPGEYMVFQVPIVVPQGALQMLWAAGVTHASANPDVITAAKVYLSKFPYTAGALSSTLFDPTTLVTTSGAVVSSTALTSGWFGSNSYNFTLGTLTGQDDATVGDNIGNGSANYSNLIFTLTCSSVSSLVMGVKDFTCWFTYE